MKTINFTRRIGPIVLDYEKRLYDTFYASYLRVIPIFKQDSCSIEGDEDIKKLILYVKELELKMEEK